MKTRTIAGSNAVVLIALPFILACPALNAASPREKAAAPCYAYLGKAGLMVSCGGPARTALRRRRIIAGFAVGTDGGWLALAESRFERDWWYPSAYFGVVDIDALSLRGRGASRELLGLSSWGYPTASCGTIIMPLRSRTRDLITGKWLGFKPYTQFRCSADNSVIVGWTKRDGLQVGLPPGRELLTGRNLRLQFDVSPNGRYVAYYVYTQRRPCVIDLRGTTVCGPENVVDFADRLSVSDSGALIFTRYSSGGIAMWRPGLGSPILLQPVGDNPQWLTPAAASALLEWHARHDSTAGDASASAQQ